MKHSRFVRAATLPVTSPSVQALLPGRGAGRDRGLVLFGAGPELAAELADGLRRRGGEPRLLATTALLSAAQAQPPAGAAPAPGPHRAGHLILFQDASLSAFARAAGAALQAVRHAWAQDTPVSLVSPLPRQAYSDLGPAADRLHQAADGVAGARSLLLAERVVTLLAQTSAGVGSRRGRPGRGAAPGHLDPGGGLDPEQLQAVEAGDGPVRVLAPAGSGKTRVLTSHILALLRDGISPSAVLALAFNRRAAQEMAARLQRQGVPVARSLSGAGVAVRTFHSLGNELVRRHLGWRYDGRAGPAAACMAEAAFEEHAGLEPGTWRHAEAQEFVRHHVAEAKRCLLPTQDVWLSFDGHPVPYAPLFAAFVERQRRARRYEFDDMVYLPLLILLRTAAWRHQVQQRFEHVLVDEFQDLNPAQLLLAEVLALPQDNLYVVGDDDQVIYSWRGARVEHLLDFEAQHPGARTFILSTNYRSTRQVVRLSQRLIGCNVRRVPKRIRPAPGASEGRVDLLAADTLGEQARLAAAWITGRQREAGCPFDHFAVLARYHAYHAPVALALDACGVPHTPLPHGLLWTQPPARVVQAYLVLLLQPALATAEHCRWVTRVPERHLPRRVTDGLDDVAGLQALPLHAGLDAWHRAQAQELLQRLDALRPGLDIDGTPAAGAVACVLEELGVRAHYRRRTRAGRPADEASEEVVLDVLAGLAEEAGSCRALLRQMDAPPRDAPSGPDGQVLLATIHATKGEGFPHVVLFNLRREERQDALVPEDERRVYYVGLTRAVATAAVTVPRHAHAPFVAEMVLDPELAGCGLRRLRWRLARLERRLRVPSSPCVPRRWLHRAAGALAELAGLRAPTVAPSAAACHAQAGRLRWEIGCRQTLGTARPGRRHPAP